MEIDLSFDDDPEVLAGAGSPDADEVGFAQPAMQPATRAPVRPIRIRNIFDNAVMLSVRTTRLGVRRKLSTDLISIDADKAMIGASKALLECDEYTAIVRADTELRAALRQLAIPTPNNLIGQYVVAKPIVGTVDSMLVSWTGKRSALVDAFINVYESAREEARMRLGVAYDAADYPTPDAARRAFALEWRFADFGLSREIEAQTDREQARGRWVAAVEEIATALREQFLELCTHLAERLAPEADGSVKMFRASTIKNLQTFIDTFDIRNVTDDDQLGALVTKARDYIRRVAPATVRSNMVLRDSLAATFSNIVADTQTMIASGRAVVFDENE